MNFEGRRSACCGEPKTRPVAPIETFARSWLAAISSIFMIFMDFDGFSKIWCHNAPGPVNGPVAPIETFARSWLAAISSIFMIFMDFHRF